MTIRLVPTLIVVIVVAFLAAVGGGSVDAATARHPRSAPSQTNFDGNWSVVINTTQGACERAFRFGIQIRDGQVLYDGGSVSMVGRVAPNGTVRVRVAAGDQQ